MKKRVTRSIVPNFLTLGNLFSGFTAIVYFSQGDIIKGALFIFLAAIFDMLDGVTARLIHATSELGAELDSLCDAVSFGVAPSFMLYKTFFYQYGELGILFASLPALGGVVRLARFNVQLTSFEDKLYFKGMPIPSAALVLIAYEVFWHRAGSVPQSIEEFSYFALSAIVALVMVSHIKFDNMPRPTAKSFKQRPVVSILFAVGIIASAASLGKLIFPVMMFYIIASSVRWCVLWIKEKREPEDEIDDYDDIEEY